MKNLYGGMMMPRAKPSRVSEGQNEEIDTESDDVLQVIDGRDYSIMGKISKEEKNDLNANRRGDGGPAFNEAEKFFYYEATNIYTRKNFDFLIDMLPGDKNLSLSELKKKYSKIIKTENHKKIMMEQLSCGCQRSKPDIFEADDKDKAEVITMTHQFGINQDLDDIMSLKFKVMKLKDKGILKHEILPKKLQNAEDNVKLFIEALDLIENKDFSVKCGKTDTSEKKRLYNDNKVSSLPTPPTSVSGPIKTAVTRSSPIGNTINRESRPINRITTRRSTRKRRHPSKPVNPECDFKRLEYFANSRSTATLAGKRKIISDMVDYLEAIKYRRVKCNDREKFIELLETRIQEFLREGRAKGKKRSKSKGHKKKKKNTKKKSKK